jgi:hypothetical protein
MCRTKRYQSLILTSILVLLCSTAALANSSNSALYILNSPNAQLSSSPGPYGSVSLQLNSNGTITITVTMKSTFGIAGGGPAFGFNGPANLKIASLSPGFSCCNPTGSGFGNFQYGIAGPPPKAHAPSTLSFIVSMKGNGKFQNVAQLGTLFMAHVIPKNGNTGFATTGVSVPDGDSSSGALIVLALIICSFLLVRRPTTTQSS